MLNGRHSSTAGSPHTGAGGGQLHADGGYVLGSDTAERERLRRQSLELHDHGRSLIDRVALRAGQRAIDIGCGPSGILELLSKRVGPDGRVVGLDRDRAHVTLAGELVHERGLENVDVIEGDARHTGLDADSFDLVHARLLLVNVLRPLDVLTEMVRLAAPGGWVCSQEPDALFLCEPPHPAWERLASVFHATYRRDGADPQIGRRLPDLYRQVGLVDVRVVLHADHHVRGDTRHTVLPDLVRTMRAKIVQRGHAGGPELDALDIAVRRHLNSPGTLTVPHLLFAVSGRKPSGERR